MSVVIQQVTLGLTRAELVMSILTTTYVGLTGFYAYTSHKTLKRIEEQVEVAERAAEAAELAANRTLQLERPWVILDWGKNYDVSFSVSLKNCGRTVARITSVHTNIEVKNSMDELPKQPYYGIAGDFRDVIIGPNDSPVHYEDFDILRVSGKDWNDARDGKKHLIYWGVIRYEDAARNAHETRFFYTYRNDPRRLPFFLDGPSEYNKFT